MRTAVFVLHTILSIDVPRQLYVFFIKSLELNMLIEFRKISNFFEIVKFLVFRMEKNIFDLSFRFKMIF